MTRQLQRQRARDLRKLQESILRRGLPEEPDHSSIIHLANVLSALIGEPHNKLRASQAAEVMHGVYDVSLRNSRSVPPIACARGCNYCCHTCVSVLAPEVFRIAHFIRARACDVPPVDQIVARAGHTANMTHEERHGRQIPCPVLNNGLCSAYACRPIMCRRASSTCVEDCRAVFDGGSVGWSMPRTHDLLFRAVHYSFCIALEANKLSWHSYELSAALRSVLERPDSEAAWLAGENVFSGVRRDHCPVAFKHRVQREAAQLPALAVPGAQPNSGG